MVMEHRWNARKEIGLDITIHYPPAGIVRGKTLNMSVDGALIKCQANTIPLQGVVNIIMTEQSSQSKQLCYLRALVVRHDEESLGLMFVRTNNNTHTLLRGFLHQGAPEEVSLVKRRDGVGN